MADSLIWLYRKSFLIWKAVGLFIMILGKYTLLPSILFVYRNFLKIKIRLKNLRIANINWLIIIRKYLPSTIIVIIVISVTTNNIFAQNYSTDEYANRTLLSNIVPNSDDQGVWNEIVEETGPAINQAPNINYIADQGSLQQLVIDSPIDETPDNDSGISTDSNLVLLSPGDNDSSEFNTDLPGKRTDVINYTIQSGDVLGSIAEKFGISVNTILWENNLNWNSLIRPGQTLRILPDSGINHEVKSGDTVLAIANKYQVDAAEIVSINKLADSSDIAVGEKLFIPNGVKPTQVVSSYKPQTPVVSVYSDEDVAPASNADSGTKLLWPTLSSRITQYYHWGHSAIDIGDKTGNPIYAAEAGKVETAGWNNGGYGYYVIINHGNGLKTLYAHASKVLVEDGDTVARGETIALIGSTGRSTGPHLHFEVKLNGGKQNPLNYIK